MKRFLLNDLISLSKEEFSEARRLGICNYCHANFHHFQKPEDCEKCNVKQIEADIGTGERTTVVINSIKASLENQGK